MMLEYHYEIPMIIVLYLISDPFLGSTKTRLLSVKEKLINVNDDS